MKKHIVAAVTGILLAGRVFSQTYSPIATTGYTLDAVAENTTALSTTGGSIDGSNYIMYSQAYGAIYGGGATGLPNSGLIANGTRTYQLQSYTTTNVLYVPGGQSDSLIFVNPAPYPSISIIGFATEGNATMNLKVRFTDGSTQLFSNVSLSDWFSGTNTVVTGFDRANRNTGTPSYVGGAGNPKMYYTDINLTCANSQKSIQRIVFQNTVANARLCIMGASGAMPAVITATSSPVTCAGGTNGSATVTVSNGVPTFTYTWPGQTPQLSNVGNVLPTGNVTFTVTDASGCQFTAAVNVGQNILPNGVITITPSAMQVCSGYSVELSSSGAVTYTWSNNGNSVTTTVNPVSATLYSVVATTSDNCTVTGSITINTIPLPVLTFTLPPKLCSNAAPVPLVASPSGGTFAGNAILFNSFYPNQAVAGTNTLSYTYTDANGCTNQSTVSTTVSNPTTTISFTITPATICSTAPSITLNAQPSGGTFSGQGVNAAGVFNPGTAGLGTKTVSYAYTDENNCSYTKISSITVNYCSNTGISEELLNAGLEIFPNPVRETLTLRSDRGLNLNLINATGQQLLTLKMEAGETQHLDVEGLAAGIYFIVSNDGTIRQKLIVTQ